MEKYPGERIGAMIFHERIGALEPIMKSLG